jgi:hypothetical protein
VDAGQNGVCVLAGPSAASVGCDIAASWVPVGLLVLEWMFKNEGSIVKYLQEATKASCCISVTAAASLAKLGS